MECISLRNQVGNTYQIQYDPSYCAQYGQRSRIDDPWLQIIPGTKGHIYLHGDCLLAVATNTRGPTATRIANIPGVTVVQDGDDGINATFPVELLPQIAALIGAKRRRRKLSENERARFIAAGAVYRFTRGADCCENDLGMTIERWVDSQAQVDSIREILYQDREQNPQSGPQGDR
jgi:hypothetical protein